MVKYHPRLKPVQGFQERQHPLYMTWANMRYRCENPDDPVYDRYGGRGITVCKEWSESFEAFALDMGLPPTPEHTLDRKENDKGYYKDNCRWATRTEQCLNRRIFSNNTSGETGITKLENGTYNARYDEEKQRYNLGRFSTLEDAASYRNKFLELFAINKEAALKMTERRARLDSAAKIKGISKNEQGYIVRVTLLNGIRKYLGFSKTLEGAIEKLNAFQGEYK
jgi:hypothetical protein